MKKIWHDDAWDDYVYWQKQDRKTLNRINLLLKDIDRNGYAGIGRPEALKHDMSGWWSREIDEKNRIVYRILDNLFEIAQCGSHYRDK
jgi:toxin YoeB